MPSSSSTSTNLHPHKSQKHGAGKEFGVDAHEVPSGPNPISNRNTSQCPKKAQTTTSISQLDKFKQELTTPNATINVAQVSLNSDSSRTSASYTNGEHFYCGRGRQSHGKGRGRQYFATGTTPKTGIDSAP
ncbi:hypothetical protein KIW84_034548 [Lathyrus oleraceus]|uniref:Uncharacterized protein n=1 Tax=Pisum sativum TaxID=3888 RepID=A0A9D5B4P9_PEA|nr:hypothetical protein KIW84_034548 [Pisum sativum]